MLLVPSSRGQDRKSGYLMGKGSNLGYGDSFLESDSPQKKKKTLFDTTLPESVPLNRG